MGTCFNTNSNVKNNKPEGSVIHTNRGDDKQRIWNKTQLNPPEIIEEKFKDMEEVEGKFKR